MCTLHFVYPAIDRHLGAITMFWWLCFHEHQYSDICHLLLILFRLVFETVSYSVSQAGFEFGVPLASVSQMLGLQACITIPGFLLLILLGKYPEVELLDNMKICFRTAILFSIVAAPFYIPTNNTQGF
jgi:hypothetical protein